MIESRCGTKCSECGYRESVGCKGCIAIDKPFWGDECPLKTCAEQKRHAHCGVCAEFPCDNLTRFAYDKEEGDEGKRIEQCRIWKKEN